MRITKLSLNAFRETTPFNYFPITKTGRRKEIFKCLEKIVTKL